MKQIAIILLVYSFCTSCFFLIKCFIQSKRKKSDFIKYLKQKNEFQLLYELGYTNKDGYEEERRVPFIDDILLDYYNKSKDEKYIDYAKYIRKSSLKIILFGICAFFCLCSLSIIL